MKRVLFVAAENGALPGGKVGGIGDVVRDLPVALCRAGWESTVVTPAYGVLHTLPGAQHEGDVQVPFAGHSETAQIWRLSSAETGVDFLLVEHPLLSACGAGNVYCDDGPHRPFATDAHKFAFFCAAVGAWLISEQESFDVVHLHDWHAACLLLLRESDPRYAALREQRFVYSIHNLALQGIRPLDGDSSSLHSWFPDLDYDIGQVVDPRYVDCINPMAVGIRLADGVNTVSPTYAREVLLANDATAGFSGSEGLEADTRAATEDGRLVGILNGCMYPQRRRARGWKPLARVLADLPGTDAVRAAFRSRRPRTIVTSVGRVTDQKVALFLQSPGGAAPTALDAILARLGSDSLFVMLGSGDPHLEDALRDVFARHDNALLVNSYSEVLADHLYDCGDLFLMPSSFEPCGISQMLAMRSGQPCVVHGVGGLRDTVRDGETGFVFEGATPAEQARAFVTAFDTAMKLRETHPDRWREISKAASAERFTWDVAARNYVAELYAV